MAVPFSTATARPSPRHLVLRGNAVDEQRPLRLR